MGEVNDVLMDYLKDNDRFADLFNGILFGGESVIRAEELFEGSEVFVEVFPEEAKQAGKPEGTGEEEAGQNPEAIKGTGRASAGKHRRRTAQRIRDVKKWLRSGYGLRILALENQNLVDYAMPWRGMNYDDLQYGEQIRRLRRENRAKGRLKDGAERMCGLRKEDRLAPVYTLCLYHGEELWDGPKSLKDMMDFGRDGERWEKLFVDYGVHLICLNEMTDCSCFHSPLRELFALVPRRKDKRALKEYMEGNAAYRSLDEETARAASVLIGMKGFDTKKEKYREEEGYNMCTALRELVEDGRKEGMFQGELRGRQLCYLNALEHSMPEEEALMITGLTKKEAEEALRLREQGKL